MRVRAATAADVPELRVLLNEIIAIGGTTAHEVPLSDSEFSGHFLEGPDLACCFVAEAPDGTLLGFQTLERSGKLPVNWVDVGTFARAAPKVPGVGTALFAASKARAGEGGFVAINATIRADNTGGLAYYGKMGFVDYAVAKGVRLADGTPVDRIFKRYTISAVRRQMHR